MCWLLNRAADLLRIINCNNIGGNWIFFSSNKSFVFSYFLSVNSNSVDCRSPSVLKVIWFIWFHQMEALVIDDQWSLTIVSCLTLLGSKASMTINELACRICLLIWYPFINFKHHFWRKSIFVNSESQSEIRCIIVNDLQWGSQLEILKFSRRAHWLSSEQLSLFGHWIYSASIMDFHSKLTRFDFSNQLQL